MKRGRGGVEYEDLEAGSGATATRGCTVEVEPTIIELAKKNGTVIMTGVR